MNPCINIDKSNVSVSPSGELSNIEEKFTDPVDIFNPGEDSSNIMLKRGQYRYKGKIAIPDHKEKILVENETWRVKQDGEFKRIFIHKLNMIPTGEQDKEGNYIYIATSVFSLIDNPVWLVPAIKALTVVGGSVGVWFGVDKLQEFTEESTFDIVSIGLTALAIIVAINWSK